jgi:hypothetical protein
VPGALKVRVTRPLELTDTRAPRSPALALTPRPVNVSRIPARRGLVASRPTWATVYGTEGHVVWDSPPDWRVDHVVGIKPLIGGGRRTRSNHHPSLRHHGDELSTPPSAANVSGPPRGSSHRA